MTAGLSFKLQPGHRLPVAVQDPRADGISLTWIVMPLAVLLRFAGGAAADAAFFLLALWCLTGPRAIILSIFLCWFFSSMNPGISAPPLLGALDRYLVLACAFAGMLGARHRHITRSDGNHWSFGRFSAMTLMLGVIILMHSLVVSPYPDVSILKVLSWQLALVSLLECWAMMSPKEQRRTEKAILTGLALIAIASLPLLFTPVGRLRNGTGFQGLIAHPQALGVMLALLGSWTLTLGLSTRNPDMRMFAMAALCVFLILQSEARTAGLTMVGSVGLAALTISFLTGRRLNQLIPALFSARFAILMLGLAFVAALMFDQISATLGNFMAKSGRAESGNLEEVYQNSRGGLIGAMQANISATPLEGIGFGIASTPEKMVVVRDSVLGLPVSAVIEKGVVPLMVIEELGIPLACLMAIWCFMMVRRASFAGLAPLAVTLAVLVVNLGEAVLFSAGGMGLLTMVLTSWAVSRSQQE